MRYNDAVKDIADQSGITQTDVKAVIKTLTNLTIKELQSGGSLRLPGLGTLSSRPNQRTSYTLRGKVYPARRKKVIAFSPAQNALEAVG